MDRHLVAKPDSSLHSVECVTPTVILGHVCESADDAALRADRVNTLVMHAVFNPWLTKTAADLGPAPPAPIMTVTAVAVVVLRRWRLPRICLTVRRHPRMRLRLVHMGPMMNDGTNW